MSVFSAIDLSQLPPPDLVEEIDYTQIKAETLEKLAELDPTVDTSIESDPAVKLIEAVAYREMIVRQRVNDAARANMLAYAKGGDLDQIGANYKVQRLLITPANPNTIPPTPAVYESDDDFRRRIQLSPEGYTTAGSEGSYIYHALTAHPDIKDASALSPSPGVVSVYILSRSGNGTASEEVLAAARKALNKEDVRPMTDNVGVHTTGIVNYAINAELVMYPGPDTEIVRKNAEAAVKELAESLRKNGYDVSLSALYRALHQPGVQRVNLISPTNNLIISQSEASFATSITVTAASDPNV